MKSLRLTLSRDCVGDFFRLLLRADTASSAEKGDEVDFFLQNFVKENTTCEKTPFSISAECAIIDSVETPTLLHQEGKSNGACYDEGNV